MPSLTPNAFRRATFRARLRGPQCLLGTFVKTPSPHAVEILGAAGFDFVVLDAEHAPMDRATLDVMILAAWAANLPALVRVGDSGAAVLSALDCGAAGVLVPHVASGDAARLAVAACRYRGGGRGFSNTTRAGGYGALGMAELIAQADAQVACIAMVEDAAALDRLEEIAAVPGLDAVFIGRGDLAVSMGRDDPGDPSVAAAVARAAAAAAAASLPVMVLSSSQADAAAMAGMGATVFVLSNDQSFLLRGARLALREFTASAGGA